MAKLTFTKLSKLKVGGTLSDPAVHGLRYRSRATGIFGEYRYKAGPGDWRSVPVGRVPAEAEVIAAWEAAGKEGYFDLTDEGLGPIRQEAIAVKRRIVAGHGPDEQPAGSLGDALDRYEASLNARGVVAVDWLMSLLRREMETPLGKDTALGSLDRAALVKRVNAVRDSGRPGAAKQLKTRMNVFLGWAQDEGMIPANPLAGWRSPRRTRAEMLEAAQAGRALVDSELAAFWRATVATASPFGPFLRVLLLTGQRLTETSVMRWRDVDLKAGFWTIPKEITKSTRAHRVPLPPLACRIIRRLPRESAYVFPGRSRKEEPDAPMTGWSNRLRDVRKITAKHGVAHWSSHDLRRTVKSGLAALRVLDLCGAAILLRKPAVHRLCPKHRLLDGYVPHPLRGFRGWPGVCHIFPRSRPLPPCQRANSLSVASLMLVRR